VKKNYLIQNILRKIVGDSNKRDSLNILNISEEAKEKAGEYHKEKTNNVATKERKQSPYEESNEFIQYQKEIEAIKLLKLSEQPDPPGKILKLTITDKEELL
jgi:hypothetical protein